MAALWRAPAPQDLSFQLGFCCCQQRLIAENICAVFLDDLLAIAVAADHEWIAPLRGAANIDVERCAFAVNDFRCSSARHKKTPYCPAGRSPGERRASRPERLEKNDTQGDCFVVCCRQRQRA